MIRNVYAIRDIKSGYLAPMLDINDQVAIRNFRYALSKPGTLEFSNIQDFDLMFIGTYDDDTGVICAAEHRIVYEGAYIVKEGQTDGKV